MRRKDREITDMNDILSIIKKCDVCRLALHDEPYPYIVPLNFGYSMDGNTICLYFHSAPIGKKMTLLKHNCNVSFEMDCSHKLIAGEVACQYSMEYESVIGSGMIEILLNDQKEAALDIIMKQYDARDRFHFDKNAVKAVTLLKLAVLEITGKRLKHEKS